MKKNLATFLLVISIHCFAVAQSGTELITTQRIGVFKLKTTKTDIEKIIGKKIELESKDYLDSVQINYGGVNYILVFSQDYGDDGKKLAERKLYAVSSTTTSLKTKSLIGIGSTKAEILLAYDKFDLTIYNDYDYKQKLNPKDKIQFICLRDFDGGTQITFTTENRVVKKIEVSIDEGE